MLDELIDQGAAAVQFDWRLTTVVAVLSLFASTLLVTTIRSTFALRQTGEGKTPTIAPYAVPVAGNLFAFAFNTFGFINNILMSFGSNIPVRIRVLNRKIYFVSGAENVLAMFRGSRELTTAPATIIVLENAFGSPSEDMHIFRRDNTGIYSQPLEGSDPVEPHNRVFHLIHKTVHNNLSGSPLVDLSTRFMTNLELELNELEVGDEWTDVPDLYSVIQATVFKASTTALCGPHLFSLNPDFTADFWNFDNKITGLFKLLPTWIIPKSYRVRDKLKRSITKWHTFASKNFDWADEELAKQDYDEYYGSKLMRERQRGYKEVQGMGDESRAANDLGMIWGANANIVPIVGWSLLDTLIRPEVLSKARAEIATAIDPLENAPCGLQMSKLVANPFLQSIYAEELRLRNGVMIQRVPITDNFQIGGWKIPKDNMMIASSWHEQRDRTVWNEGPVKGEFHSVEDFWAERFLIFPNDPNSGPRKPGAENKLKPTKTDTEDGNEPKFTVEPVTGSWVPYGGGAKICPGRFYAKQEAIGGVSLFLTMFDIELKQGKDNLPLPNMGLFPFGVVPPLGKFPARMRKRKQVHL